MKLPASSPRETSMQSATPGKLIIISGPSGAGKTTVVRRLLKKSELPLELSISATTRPPREGEVDGQDYHFLTFDQFQEKRKNGEFLECFEVFGKGYWYGTLEKPVATSRQAGKWVILEIDVQGAIHVIGQHADAITIFVRPSSLEELERRLRGRGTETEEKIQQRLATARHEIEASQAYEYTVINEDVEAAVQRLCAIFETSGA